VFAALDAVIPIFLLVAAGYVVARWRILDERIGEALSIFAARIGIPVLIFRALLLADFSSVSPWKLWACYFPAAAVAWTLGHVLTLKVLGRDERTSVIGGVGSAFANTAFVGLPLAERVYGQHGVMIVTLLIAVHMPLMMTAATLLMERAERRSGGDGGRGGMLALVRQILSNLAVNPIVLAIVAAVVWRLGGLPLPSVAEPAVSALATAAGPVALLALGMSLTTHRMGREMAPTLAISAIKLLVMPILVLLTGRLAGLAPDTLGPLVLLAGVPAGVNVHLVAVQYRVGQALGAGIVVCTTMVGVVTSTGWLALLAHV
jgi:malonate transporter and related proteins